MTHKQQSCSLTKWFSRAAWVACLVLPNALVAEDADDNYCLFPTPEFLAWEVSHAFETARFDRLYQSAAADSIQLELEYAIDPPDQLPATVTSLAEADSWLLKQPMMQFVERDLMTLWSCADGVCRFVRAGISHNQLYLTELHYQSVQRKVGVYEIPAAKGQLQDCYQVTMLRFLHGN